MSKVLEIWHIRDRFSQEAALLGATNGEELVVPVANLRSILFQPAQSTWFARLGGVKMTATLEFLDGKTDSFVTDSKLFVQKQSGEEKIPVGNLRSIVRCGPGTQIPVIDTGLDRPVQRPVSGVSSTGSPADRVKLNNGDILSGEVITETFHWTAPYAELRFHGWQIRSISQPEQGVSQGLLELRSGDRISGVLTDPFIEIRLRDGQRVQVPSQQLRSIEFPGVLD
ncbi:MAG: hypothetical protein V3R51_06975, partial [Gammaproteobacteria bacterium]